jgi:hypothetical protein
LGAQALAALLCILATESHAECPPRSTQFRDFPPLKVQGCAEGGMQQQLRRVKIFTDGVSLFFSEPDRIVEFSTAYSMDDGKITTVTDIYGDYAKIGIPDREAAPYAIIDDLTGSTVFLIGTAQDYQLQLTPPGEPLAVSNWTIPEPPIRIARGELWLLSEPDARIADPAKPMVYGYLSPISCIDFDFVVPLPEPWGLALISSQSVTHLGEGKTFAFDDKVSPQYGLKRKLRQGSTRMSVDGDRVIGSVAGAPEDARLWLRLMDAPSEGDRGRAHYTSLVRGPDGSITWAPLSNGTDQASWWCFE